MSDQKKVRLADIRKAISAPARVAKAAVQELREGTVGKAVDAAIDKVDKFLGPSGKAWLANGLDELRQAVALGNGQVQAGNNPGLWGTITTGEATAERLAGDKDKEQTVQASQDVPKQKKFSLEELRGIAAQKSKEAQQRMERGHDRGHER